MTTSRPEEPPQGASDYPRAWQYRVIGRTTSGLQAAIAMVILDVPYAVVPSRMSRGGRWQSLIVKLTVRDHDHQSAIHQALADHPDVRYVL